MRFYLGTFNRFVVDDYCWPGFIRDSGFLRYQWEAYIGSFGRYSSTFLISIFALADQPTAPVISCLVLIAWLAALTWCGYELSRIACFEHPFLIGLVGAQIVTLAVIFSVPDNLQPLVWQVGALTYAPPLVLIPAGIAWALRGRSVVVLGLLGFIIAGFNEETMAAQIVALVLLLPAAGRYRQPVRSTLIGASVGGLLVIISPGNFIRHSQYGHPSLAQMGAVEISSSISLAFSVLSSPVVMATFILTAYIVSRYLIRSFRWPSACRIVGFGVVLFLAAVAPAAFGVLSLYGRAAFWPSLVAVLTILALAVRLGREMRPRVSDNWLAGVALGGLLIATVISDCQGAPVV